MIGWSMGQAEFTIHIVCIEEQCKGQQKGVDTCRMLDLFLKLIEVPEEDLLEITPRKHQFDQVLNNHMYIWKLKRMRTG